jgi:hypothetical protein
LLGANLHSDELVDGIARTTAGPGPRSGSRRSGTPLKPALQSRLSCGLTFLGRKSTKLKAEANEGAEHALDSAATPGASVARETLYEEVWSEPMTAVAARYGVSGSFLARVCSRLSVPRPPRGYWARHAAGKATKRLALPPPRPQDELTWNRRGAAPTRVPRPLPKPPDATRRPRRRAAALRPTLHPLIRGAREHFDAARERDHYLRPAKKRLVDLVVSKQTLPRALELANALFLALEDRGHSVEFAPAHERWGRGEIDVREAGRTPRAYPTFWSPWRSTVVFIGTVAVGLTLHEMSEEVECRYLHGTYVRASELGPAPRGGYGAASWTSMRELPSGRLCLEAYAPYPRAKWTDRWREAKPGDLQAKLRTIARALEAAAPVIAQEVEAGEREAEIERQRWEAAEQKRRREEAARARAEARKASRATLAAIIERWAEAKRVEAFFEDAARRAASIEGEASSAMLERLQRARELLGGVDALERFRSWQTPEERLAAGADGESSPGDDA